MVKFFLGFVFPLCLFLSTELTLRLFREDKLSVAEKIIAVPAVGAQLLLVKNRNIDLVPLGGISRSTTVLCKENSDWSVYSSDLYGFPNPMGVWNENQIDIAFVGDSYFQGGCLSEDKTLVNYFRKENSVLNLSSFGHGPLAHLGLILEYLTEVKPRKVLLSLVPNDLNIDLGLEYGNKTLRGYLEGRIQNLKERQIEIDLLFKKFMVDFPKSALRTDELLTKKLFNKSLLALFRPQPQRAGYRTDYEGINREALELYEKILKRSNDLVQSWQGELFVVFIPDAYFFSNAAKDKAALYTSIVEDLVRREGIRFINLEYMFKENESPFDDYAPVSDFYGHFNERGAQKAFSFISQAIKNNVRH